MNFCEYKYRTETHAHTFAASPCSEFSPEELVDLYEGLSYDTLIITNHFSYVVFEQIKGYSVCGYLDEYKRAVEYAKNKNISVILGMEIRFKENDNDYLVFGIDEEFIEKSYSYLDTTLEKFYTEMKNDKNVILQAHPFRDGMTPMPVEFLDGVEVFNMHPNHNSRISLSARYAQKKPGMIISGGTDCHHPTHEGCISLNTKEKITDSFMFAEILKSGDYIFDVVGNKIIPYNFKMLEK